MTPIPTIKEISDGIISDVETKLDITIPSFGKSVLRVFIFAKAAKMWLFYIALAKVQKNALPDTAEPESSGGTLERWGRAKMNRNPFPATQGQHVVTVTGSVGATIQAQTTFKSDDDSASPGKIFILDTAYVLATTTDSITVRALEAGTISRLSVGDTLTSTKPIPNVDSSATVSSTPILPSDGEDIEDYREKTMTSFRREPQGGAPADYRIWGLDASGVKQIYPYPVSGAPNEVDVFVEATIADSADGKGTPTTAIKDEVEECIELDPDTSLPIEERGRRPITTFAVNVQDVTIKEVDVTIAALVDSTPEKVAAILAALTDEIARVRPFVAAIDTIAERYDVVNTNNLIAAINTAIPGGAYGTVTLEVDGTPVSSFTFIDGNIPHLNSVNYV